MTTAVTAEIDVWTLVEKAYRLSLDGGSLADIRDYLDQAVTIREAERSRWRAVRAAFDKHEALVAECDRLYREGHEAEAFKVECQIGPAWARFEALYREANRRSGPDMRGQNW